MHASTVLIVAFGVLITMVAAIPFPAVMSQMPLVQHSNVIARSVNTTITFSINATTSTTSCSLASATYTPVSALTAILVAGQVAAEVDTNETYHQVKTVAAGDGGDSSDEFGDEDLSECMVQCGDDKYESFFDCILPCFFSEGSSHYDSD